MTIESGDERDKSDIPAKHDDANQEQQHGLNTIGEVFANLRDCWTPPPKDVARSGTQ